MKAGAKLSSMTRSVQRDMIRRRAAENETSFAEEWVKFHPNRGKKRKYIGANRSISFVDRLNAYRSYVEMVKTLREQAKEKTTDPEAATEKIAEQLGAEVIEDNT